MNKKIEIEYLNYTDLNNVENEIEELTNYIQEHFVENIPEFNRKTWVLNELPFIQEIDRIEKGITNIGFWFYKPNGWTPTKEWITSDNLYPVKSFDYRDYNRWINDLTLINLEDAEEMTFWNGISKVDWDVQSNYEWEEI